MTRRVPCGDGPGAGAKLRTVAGACALVAVAAALAGCAANPATGKSQLNLYNEAQEIEIGRQAAAEVEKQMAFVADPALEEYVAGIGRKLAAASERPGLPWSFRIVDDPVVNAFALPGGFIYVTRGLLAHVSTEAELASVIGHEIAHVTAQHGVNQMSKQQVAAGGLLLGMILSSDVAQAADVAQAGLGLLFLKYGRDDERQADDLGLRYLTKSSYEAREMPRMFRVLEAVGQISGGGRIPNWLATHPEPGMRRERSEQLIAQRKYPPGEVGAESLLRRLDGMQFGPDPREGFFEGTTFYHPGFAVQFEIPAVWRAVNEKARVVALHPDGVAELELTVGPGAKADEAARAFLGREGISTITSRKAKIHGLAAVLADFSVATQRAISGRAAFIEKGGKVFQLVGLVYSDRAVVAREAFERTLGSFATLKDRARLEARPQQVRVVELTALTTFDEFRRSHPADLEPRLYELINRVDDPARPIPAGTLLKRIEGKRAGPQTAGPPLG
ncbi:MAG: M48 family metalloprotease [Thermoanaerobaculia bacterium]|nr:MAG: M48 family metalloprotease [Thermoanaerobaculia bacterium]